MHYSCQIGDLKSVEILTNSGAKLSEFSNNQRTPLHLAANMNFPAVVKFLLEQQADSNCKDHYGCTPLHLAAKQGNDQCIDLLLAFGSDLYSLDFRHWNILHYASFHGNPTSVRFISKYDADKNILQTQRNSQNKLAIEIVKTPNIKPFFISLWHAAKEGDLDMIRQLLNDGENINEKTIFNENTPLHLSVFNNHYLAVRLIMDSGGDANIRNKDEVTPVDYAALINSLIMMKYNPEKDNEVIDLKDYVRDVYNKNEKTLNAVISNKNNKLRFWNVHSFSGKITNMLTG